MSLSSGPTIIRLPGNGSVGSDMIVAGTVLIRRFSFSIIRASILCVCLVILIGCAAAPPAERVTDEKSTLEGCLKVEGSNPFDRSVTIEDSDGIEWKLLNPGLEIELARLEEFRVRVRYPVSGLNDIEHTLNIESYEIIPPEGTIAIEGVLDHIDGRLSMTMKSGKRFLMSGALAVALSNYSGYRAWVWGTVHAASSASEPDLMQVEGYEVMSNGVVGDGR